MADSERQPPTAEELAWLSVAPPTDEQGRPVAWTLRDRRIADCNWDNPIVHTGLTLERVRFDASRWAGATFRNCVFREVTFKNFAFARAKFDYVLFERCVFEMSTFTDSELVRTTIGGSELHFVTASRVRFENCRLIQLEVTVLELRDCELSTSPFSDCAIVGLRGSKLRGDALSFTRGSLAGDLTACTLAQLELDQVTLDKFKLIDCELEQATQVGGRASGLALSGTRIGTFRFARLEQLVGLAITDSNLTELSIEGCAQLVAPMLANSSVARLSLLRSGTYDLGFDEILVGEARIEGCTVAGAMFRGGRWRSLLVTTSALGDYLGVTGTHFEALRLANLNVADNFAPALDGDSYGAGSMTWNNADGS